MRAVWKYPFPIADEFTTTMPANARILHVDEQHGSGTMWALCRPEVAKVKRRFRIYGTGHPIPDDPLEYVGTFIAADGYLVWHLFEVVP